MMDFVDLGIPRIEHTRLYCFIAITYNKKVNQQLDKSIHLCDVDAVPNRLHFRSIHYTSWL